MRPSDAAAPSPPLPFEPAGPFDMWRDYLGLAALLRDPPGGDGDPKTPPSSSSPGSEPAPGPPCAFCRHNGEAPAVYQGHSLRDAGGRLQCPVLRSYVCPQCGATQDRAHTRRFCPLTPRGYTSVYERAGSARSGAGSGAGSARSGARSGAREGTARDGGE
ncbi:nanos homolog 3-like [Pipra filicauda]|uniref:Nanos homolog 3-like n=1 Tax=Pipra filicauda TaxID=649802 RepID=A0A7R5KDQ5_9PASS|nr:nanos homolog 3-like [Pipra filicauda]